MIPYTRLVHVERLALALGIVCLLAVTRPAAAQPAEAFAAALVDVAVAARGSIGDEGPMLVAAIDRLAASLEQWDGVIANMERGLAAEIGKAPRPVAARMRATLGSAYLERGRSTDAVRELDLAVALEPQLAVAHTLRGIALDRLNRSREARAAFAAAWQHGPDAVTAYQFLRSGRQAQRQSGSDPAKPLAVLTGAVDRSVQAPQDPVEILGMRVTYEGSEAALYAPSSYAPAFVLIAADRYAEAIAVLRNVAAADPLVTDTATQTPEAKAAIAASRSSTGAALEALAAAVSRYPQSMELRRLLGARRSESGSHADAVALLNGVVRDRPRDERARMALFKALVDAGELVAAAKALQATAAAFPQSWQAQFWLSTVLERLGDGAGAVQALQAAAKITRSPTADRALGRLHHAQLNLEPAVAAYQRGLAALPGDGSAHQELGVVYRDLGRLDDAAAEFAIAALLAPGDRRAFAELGQLYAAAGDDARAVPLLRYALAGNPDLLAARYALSRALLRLGHRDEAARELEVFQQQQRKAMEAERQRFEENSRKIDEVLRREP